jgi:hypothetical protein
VPAAARGRTVRRRNAGGRGRERGDPRARIARARAAAEAGDRGALGEVYQEGLRQGVVPRPALEALALFNDPVALEVVGEVRVGTRGPEELKVDAGSRLRCEDYTLGDAASYAAWGWGPPLPPSQRAYAFAAILGKAAFEASVVDVASISEAVQRIDEWWSGQVAEDDAVHHAWTVQHLSDLHHVLRRRLEAGPSPDGGPEHELVGEVAAQLYLTQVGGWWSVEGRTWHGDDRRRLTYGGSALEAVHAVIDLWGLPHPNAFDAGILARLSGLAVRHAWEARQALDPRVLEGRAAVEAHLRANLRPWVLDGCPGPWPNPRAVTELAEP